MSILIELKQREPWPAQSPGGQPLNSDEVSWRTLQLKKRGGVRGLGGGEVNGERRGMVGWSGGGQRRSEGDRLVNDEGDS